MKIEYLTDMYNDSYYPVFLVDKVKSELMKVSQYLQEGEHTTEDIQEQFDIAIRAINDLEEEFEKNESEIETVARDSIGVTVENILTYFDLDIDIEDAIREREW